MLRIKIVKVDAEEYTIIQTKHHSILDGWSGPILFARLFYFYEMICQGKEDEIIIKEDNAYLEAQEYIFNNKVRANEYWESVIADVDSPNDINSLLSEPVSLNNYRFVEEVGEVEIQIKGEDYANIKAFTAKEGLTINSLIQFVWHKLIQVYTNSKKTIVGTTVSGRDLPVEGIEDSVGLFINTLPLIIDWDNNSTIIEQLKQIQQKIVEINTHSFSELSSLQKNGERLFHSLFVYENYPMPEGDNGDDLSKINIRGVIEKVDYPMSIMALEDNQYLTIKLGFDQKYMSETKAKKHLESLESILKEVLVNPNEIHNTISLLDEEEFQNVVYNWNNTTMDFPSDKTIVDLFESQVVTTPSNKALISDNLTLTYQELNEKVNQVSNYLLENQIVSVGDIVGVMQPKSELALISILAIIKCGAAYLPIDVEYPKERIDYMIEDSKLKLILKSTEIAIDTNNSSSLNIEDLLIIKSDTNTNNPGISIKPEDIAYIIYTSGSTGNPKGVMIKHTSNVNMSLDQVRKFNVEREDRVVWFASMSFDASVSEIMMALYAGATLLIPEEGIKKDVSRFTTWMKEKEANIVTFPPSYLDLLQVEDYSFLKSIITAGEAAHPEKGKEIIANKVDLYNAYGPTECAVCVSILKVGLADCGNTISIGTPIANMSCYVLDEYLNPVPVGVEGSLYVSGVGLAKGYLNKPELTAEKFIDNPFRPNDVMYDTGDLVKWLDNGSLEFIGRRDQQVKLNGYRIELGEIEHIILSEENIKQVKVEVKSRGNEKALVAYIVGTSNDIDKVGLREILKKKLPDYMVPSYFISLDLLPLNVNGKVDRKALPDVEDADIIKKAYVGSRNEVEAQLVGVWEEVLGLDRIGINDNFFEMGANSLILVKVWNKVNEILQVDLELSLFFQYPTISLLAENLSSNKEDGAEDNEQLQEEEDIGSALNDIFDLMEE